MNWQSRIIENDNQGFPVDALPSGFVSDVTSAQIAANKGWAPKMDALVDRRVGHCPNCNAPGMNTCFGYWVFTCGAEILSGGEVSEPCSGSPKNA